MKEYIDNAMTFAEYIKLIDDLLLDGKTTGPNQSEAMVGYGKLNRHRMHRLEKTVTINDSLKAKAKNIGSQLDLAGDHRRLVRRCRAEYPDH